ncbi:TRICHOME BIREFRINGENCE-LIKE 22 [Euphorbia peplus]|nr:TRICHOME BIREFRINGENCE-LIKE 22 [Euphorbia peplus]
MGKRKLNTLVLSSLCMTTTIFSLFLLYSPNPFKSFPIHHHNHNSDQKILMMGSQNEEEKCDLFKGHWRPEINAIRAYTNLSCATIPESNNCFKNGRQDTDFLNWRWKPDKCDLPMFDSREFLEIVRGKTMAFVGDSVARNHMESLLCLLSQEEVPIYAYKDAENRNRIWRFPSYNFTLEVLWTKFLVSGEERTNNGSSSGVFDVYLDKIDSSWSTDISNMDYIIISAGHWFFRPIYLHKGRNVIACIYCNEPNITDRGGSCNRTSPSGESEINLTSRGEWELRSIQVEEIERVKKIQGGKRFEALDVTRAMVMRRDGHPGSYWDNKWMRGYNDCVHWCLPGPIDLWNDMLLALLRKLSS